MFIAYTITYIILLYFGPTVEIISPLFMIVLSLLREFYLVFVFFYFVYSVSVRNRVIFSAENILFFLCLFFALPFILQAGIVRGLTNYIIFFSGPYLFLVISNLRFSETAIRNYRYMLRLVLDFLCMCGIPLYFLQGKIVDYFGYENFKNFFLTDVSEKLRLFGLGFHPTTTGFLYIYTAALLFFTRKNKIKPAIYFCANLLSHTRSALFGIPSYVFFKLKKHWRFLIIPLIGFAFFVIFRMVVNKSIYKYLDPSAIVHLLHLFVTGPQAVLQYPFGTGLGTVSPYSEPPYIIHLESDVYLYSIQLGIFNLVLYISAIIVIIRKLLTSISSETKYLVFIVLTFMLGCFVFPLHSLRFTSNFVFIELGFWASKNHWNTRSVGQCSLS